MNRAADQLTKMLGLKRKIIGVHFLYTFEEYNNLEVKEYGKRTSYCMMVKNAMDGNHFKSKAENFGCRCASEALGVTEEMACVESGERYYSIKLYESEPILLEPWDPMGSLAL